MIQMQAIGKVHSSRKDVLDDRWDLETSRIELEASLFTPDALLGLGDFSHVEILFFMDRVESIERAARHPRNNPNWPKVGIFAQRAKNRPNQIGSTICQIDRVEGLNLYLKGLDAVDGTPVLDIKPWVKGFGPRGEIFEPSWIGELMEGYWE